MRQYAVLDTPPEACFDRITRLAARLLQAPIAQISLVDQHRQWAKSTYGIEIREIPREASFCAHAIRGRDVLVIPDAAQDARFAHNPLVSGNPRIRFYAGAPLCTPAGFRLGTLCVADTVPRAPLTADQEATLADLAAMVVDELELRLGGKAAGHLGAVEQELQRANETIRTILQTSPVSIWALDLDGNVKFWNTAAEKTFGWTEAEVLNRWPPFLWEEDYDDYRDLLARYQRGEMLRGAERRRHHRDGSVVDLNVWTAPLQDANGVVIGTIGAVLDVTETKHLQQQLLHSQKMEAIALLAGGVAHDFNNLLTVILGYSRMMRLDSSPGRLFREYVEEVEYAAERAASLTSQLLAFSRRQIAQPRVLDLNQIVRSMDKMLGRILGEDIARQTVLQPDLGHVRADPGQIEQVIANLAVNARDAMPSGGKLTIETLNVELNEAYQREHPAVQPGPYVLLAISDTGSGMSPDVQSHIFEPFFTTKEKGKGTGLGLSIIHGIVKQNQGEVWVYSEPGHGSAFKIYLPRVDQPADVITPDSRSALTLPPGTETVLVVEDDISVRQLVCDVLRKCGYTLLEAGEGGEALRICGSHEAPIHLMITDVIMPGMTGPELARQAGPLRPEMRSLLVSGYTEKAMAPDAAEGSFLQKPFTPGNLARKVREVLNANATS